jgi:hypothetical protein
MTRQRTQDEFRALVQPSKGSAVSADVWGRMSDRERIECATGRSLDNCIDILDLPLELAVRSPTVMQGKCQVIRAVLQVVTRVGLESARLRGMQEELLGKLIDDFLSEEAQENGRVGSANGQARAG